MEHLLCAAIRQSEDLLARELRLPAIDATKPRNRPDALRGSIWEANDAAALRAARDEVAA